MSSRMPTVTIPLILSVLAAGLMMLNGFEFIHRVLFIRPLGVFDGLKAAVWMGTSLAVAFFGHWWPFVVGGVLALGLRAAQASDSVIARAERARHPFYFNEDVPVDAKLNRMLTEDRHFLVLYVLLIGLGMAAILLVGKYLRTQLG